MLKYILLIFLIPVAASCSSTLSQNEGEDTAQQPSLFELEQALAQAKQNEDYRLLVTTTRGINVPGLSVSEFKSAIALCGKRYMPNTGDVIKTAQDRVERDKVINYMQQYNEKMWSICHKQKVVN
ncbi:MAG: hypothetical protein OQK09_00990 [Colwellia sp.]|nr:hypothetical protein [Colwellia sp.]MCW9080064.1 hypothetical protein [Colwellia sp.]